VPVDILDGLLQFGKRTPAISRGSWIEAKLPPSPYRPPHEGRGGSGRTGRGRVIDLDRALPGAKDRPSGLRYDGSLIYPPDSTLRG